MLKSDDPPRREWEAARDAIQWSRKQLDVADRSNQHLLTLADGSYDVNKLWESLPHDTTLLVRCAKNRRLRQPPVEVQTVQRGARRKYGEVVAPPERMRRERAYWQKITIPVRGREVQVKCRVVGPFLVEGAPNRPLMLILVKGYHRRRAGREKRKPPCQYLVNAVQVDQMWQIPLPLKTLIEGTWHRWEVEVCHREIKTSFGLGQMQCWSMTSSTNSVKFMAWAYSVLVPAGYKTCNGLINNNWTTPGRWSKGRLRWSLSTLMQAYRKELWEFGRIQPVYPRIPNKGQKIQLSKISLENSAIGCSRG